MTATLPARRTPAEPGPVRGLLAVLVGASVGALTFYGQGVLAGAFAALANSASAWLVAPFLVGALARTTPGAAAAGLATCLMQLVGYYVAADQNGQPAGGAGIVAFWAVCGLVGGPLFGVAGWWWRHGRPATRGLGAAVLPTAFLAEGLWTYAITLGYAGAAALWFAIGAALALAMLRGWAGVRWLLLLLPLALLAEVAVTAVASRPL